MVLCLSRWPATGALRAATRLTGALGGRQCAAAGHDFRNSRPADQERQPGESVSTKCGGLPYFLEALSKVRYRQADGQEILGTVLTDAVCAIYTDREDRATAALSTLADVRVAWGGREAVEAIMNLPRRFGTEDIVFGPKTSFAVVGSEKLVSDADARRVAALIARDTVALGQRGCNSPHTVFVERGGAIAPGAFAKLLGEELSRVARHTATDVAPQEAFQILGCRAEYDIRAQAWYSDGVR